MSKAPKFEIGADLFVRDPQRFNPEAVCIIGKCTARKLRSGEYWYRLENNGVPATGQSVWHREMDVGLRIGTPINHINGRPGTRGHDRYVEIALSWGYD